MLWLALTLVAVPLAWAALLGAVAAGGWPALGRRYRRGDERPAIERRFRSIVVISGWWPCNYGGCVIVGANSDGLFLRVFPLFRPFHPPLFIPWAAIQSTAGRSWVGGHVDLTFTDVPGVTVRMPKGTAGELADVAAGFGAGS